MKYSFFCKYVNPKILNILCDVKCLGYSLVNPGDFSEVLSVIYSVLYFNHCGLSYVGFSKYNVSLK